LVYLSHQLFGFYFLATSLKATPKTKLSVWL
jgi:hypothetical protein